MSARARHGSPRAGLAALVGFAVIAGAGCSTVASAEGGVDSPAATTSVESGAAPATASDPEPTALAPIATDATPVPSPSSPPSSTPSPSASASDSATPTAVGPAPVGAFVLGDSISLSVAAALSRLGYPVTGRVGASASVAYLQEHLRSAEAQAAPAWVIMLGTNNRGDENDLEQLDEWLRTIRKERSGRPRQQVYWVTPHRPEEYRGGMSTHTLDALTAALLAEAERRPWLHVLDWAAEAKANPQWYALDGARLHPDENGQQAIVDLIAGADPTTAATPAPIVTIAPPSPKATPAPDSAEGETFTDMEFTNE